jgi:hypothetical protein
MTISEKAATLEDCHPWAQVVCLGYDRLYCPLIICCCHSVMSLDHMSTTNHLESRATHSHTPEPVGEGLVT